MKSCEIGLLGCPRVLACLLLSLLIPGRSVTAQQSEPLSPEAPIALPNIKGRIDHFAVDVKNRRVFVAAVANHSLEILDLNSGQRIGSIPDLPEPQGVFYDPATDRLFVACALDGMVRIFDGKTFRMLTSVKFPDDADNIRYDGHSRQVIVGYAGAKQLRHRQEGSGGLGFIDANGKLSGEITIDAHPESFQIESSGRQIFVNVPDRHEIEVVDAVKRSIVARWPVQSAENNFPMALDETHGLLFVGCWQPPRLLAFDIQTGKQALSAEISGKTDDLFYDSSQSRIYVITSVGFLDVFHMKDPLQLERIARYATPPGTQTGLFVPEWRKLFAAAPQRGGHNAEMLVYDVR